MQNFFDEDVLIERVQYNLLEGQRPVVFMLGSALSIGPQGASDRWVGVPGVTAILGSIEEELGTLPAEARGASGYQTALGRLIGLRGPDAANAFIRDMVLESVRPAHRPDPKDRIPPELSHLEEMPESWLLPDGMAAVGRLLAHLPHRCPHVLTTNFDPLVQVAVRAAGGRAGSRVLDRDGSLSGFYLDRRSVQVIHLHGHWYRGDTLHTDTQLNQAREHLQLALERLLANAVVVVVGYGGWDDIFTKALSEVARRGVDKPEVLWCFYEDQRNVEDHRPDLLERFEPAFGRITCFEQIDAHRVLPRLARELSLREDLPNPHETLAGRARERQQVLEAVLGESEDWQFILTRSLHRPPESSPKPVQVLSLPKMGGSSYLRDLESRLRLAGVRVARVDARHFVASPAALVQEAARDLHCLREVNDILYGKHALPAVEDACAALEALGEAVLLVHHAEALAASGNGFTPEFFNKLHEMGDRGLRWISVSPIGLGGHFDDETGASPFLNDATKLHLGPWTLEECRAYLTQKRVPDDLHEWIYRETGGVPYSVWFFIGRPPTEARADASVEFDRWFQPVFEKWIDRLNKNERSILPQLAEEPTWSALSETERSRWAPLIRRGLAVKDNDTIKPRGAAWRRFVQRRPPRE